MKIVGAVTVTSTVTVRVRYAVSATVGVMVRLEFVKNEPGGKLASKKRLAVDSAFASCWAIVWPTERFRAEEIAAASAAEVIRALMPYIKLASTPKPTTGIITVSAMVVNTIAKPFSRASRERKRLSLFCMATVLLLIFLLTISSNGHLVTRHLVNSAGIDTRIGHETR